MQTKTYSQTTARNEFLKALNLEKPEVLKALRDRVFPLLSQDNVNRAVVKIGPTCSPEKLSETAREIKQYIKSTGDYEGVDWRLSLSGSIVARAAKELVPVKWSEMESSPDRRLSDEIVGWARFYDLADDDWCLEAVAQTLLLWVIQEIGAAYISGVLDDGDLRVEPSLEWRERQENMERLRWAEAHYLCYDREAAARFRVDAFRWLALFHTGTSPAKIGRKFDVSERYVEILIGKLYWFIGLTRRDPLGGQAAATHCPSSSRPAR